MDDVAREHESFFDAILLVKDLLQLRFDLIEFDIDEEADCAEVNATNGDGLLVGAAADIQERTVSADAQSHVDGALANVSDSMLLMSQERSLLRRNQHAHFFCLKESKHAIKNRTDICFRHIGKNCYGKHQIPAYLSNSVCASLTTARISSSKTSEDAAFSSLAHTRCIRYSILPSGPLTGE